MGRAVWRVLAAGGLAYRLWRRRLDRLECVGTNDVARTDPEQSEAQFRALCAGLPAGALVAELPDFRRRPRRAATGYAQISRAVLAEFPALVPVGIERTTRASVC